MIPKLQLVALLKKWFEDSEAYRAESQRLERSDRNRHGTSIAMLEASVQVIERCTVELETLVKPECMT
jgi:hypothetical protein